MTWVQHAIANAPESFLLLAVAIGTVLGRMRVRGFAIGASACILIVAVILGQLGTFVIPPVLRSLLFGLFVFTIGYRSGPEFFASLSIRTLGQVMLALLMGTGSGADPWTFLLGTPTGLADLAGPNLTRLRAARTAYRTATDDLTRRVSLAA